MTRQHALPLIARGIRRSNWGLFWLGLHLATPPVALLVLLNLVVLAFVGLLVALGASPVPMLALAGVDIAAGTALVIAWLTIGRPYLSGSAMARIPLYTLWKIPLYLKMLRGGEKNWIRTERTP